MALVAQVSEHLWESFDYWDKVDVVFYSSLEGLWEIRVCLFSFPVFQVVCCESSPATLLPVSVYRIGSLACEASVGVKDLSDLHL